MPKYENLTLDEERALYGVTDAVITNCAFEGPADGESALKETRNVRVADSRFCLRYPLWHAHGATLENCTMDETCRAGQLVQPRGAYAQRAGQPPDMA